MRIERDQEEQAIGKPQGTSSHIRRSFFPQRQRRRQIQRQRQKKFQKEWVHVYRFKFPVLMYIDAEMSLAHVDTYCPLQDKDKDNDKDKDKIHKRPYMCYIFEKQGVQGYQIRRIQ